MLFSFEALQIWIPLIGLGFLYLLSWYWGIDTKNSKERLIKKIHFKGEVVEVGQDNLTYYLVLNQKNKRIYIPHDKETQQFASELKVGAYIRKRRYRSTIKVVYKNKTKFYKYAQNPICFFRKIEDYTY